jgi:hypothetical protein
MFAPQSRAATFTVDFTTAFFGDGSTTSDLSQLFTTEGSGPCGGGPPSSCTSLTLLFTVTNTGFNPDFYIAQLFGPTFVAGNPSNNIVFQSVFNQCAMGGGVKPGASCKVFVFYNTKDLTTTPDFDGDFLVNSAEVVIRSGLHNTEVNISYQMTIFDPTPLPGALPLFASGLVGLVLLGWRRKKKAASQAP